MGLFMRRDSTALRGVHIFVTEYHPLFGHGPQSCQGGLFALYHLDSCKSKLGRQRLREWMPNPFLDPVEIAKRHDGLELSADPQHQSTIGTLLHRLGQMGPVDAILLRMHKCEAAPMDYISLTQTLSAALSITNLLDDLSPSEAQQSWISLAHFRLDGFGRTRDERCRPNMKIPIRSRHICHMVIWTVCGDAYDRVCT